MSDQRFLTTIPNRELHFDPRSTSPLIGRGLARLSDQSLRAASSYGVFSLAWQRETDAPPWYYNGPHRAPAVIVTSGVALLPTFDGLEAVDVMSGEPRGWFGLHPTGYSTLIGEAEGSGWAVTGDLLMVESDEGFCVMDPTTLAQRWCLSQQPVAVDRKSNTLYAYDWNPDRPIDDHYPTDLRVCAYDTTNGAVRWVLETYPGDHEVPDCSVSQYDHLAVINEDSWGARVVDAATGRVRWVVDSEGVGEWLVDSGTAFLNRSALNGSAHDLETGRERWRFEVPDESGSFTFVAARDGRVFGTVGDTHEGQFHHHQIYAFDALTGRIVWRQEIPYFLSIGFAPGLSTNETSDAGIVNDAPLFVSDRMSLYALDPATGHGRWRLGLDGTSRHGVPLPQISRSGAYISDQGRVHAVDVSTGKDRWTFERACGGLWLRCGVCGEVGDVVMVVSGDGTLYALDISSGEVRDQFKFSEAPSVDDLVHPMMQFVTLGQPASASNWASCLRNYCATTQVAVALDAVIRRLEEYCHRYWNDHRIRLKHKVQGPVSRLQLTDWEWEETTRLLNLPNDRQRGELTPSEITTLFDILDPPNERQAEAMEMAKEMAKLLSPVSGHSNSNGQSLPFGDSWPTLQAWDLMSPASVQIVDNTIYVATREALHALNWSASSRA